MAYIRIRMIPDSKNRSAGPYGPYAYLAWRSGKKIHNQYLGRCSSIADMKKLRMKHGNKLFILAEDAIIRKGQFTRMVPVLSKKPRHVG